MSKSAVISEARTWSQLAELLQNYVATCEKKQIGNIFGYASLIGNPGKIKGSLDRTENISVAGMAVGMNVYAAGANEFRGTTDRANGIYNVGLYAGLEESKTGETAYGVNYPLNYSRASHDAYNNGTGEKPELIVGLESFVERELGKPPVDFSVEDLFKPDAVKKFAALEGKPENNFSLYKFQIINTKSKDGKTTPAAVVSTNDQTKASAIGISKKLAALLILDGCGKIRPNGEGTIGGSCIDYFLNTMNNYKDLGYEQPRMKEIAAEVLELAQNIKKAARVMSNDNFSKGEKEQIFYSTIGQEYENVIYPNFEEGFSIASRDNVAPEWVAKSELPKTLEEKLRRISKVIDTPGVTDKLSQVASR